MTDSLVSLFCMWLLSFPSAIYWRGFLFSLYVFLLFYWILFAHIYVNLFLDSVLFHWPVSTMLFWLLLLCSITWTWTVWYLSLVLFFSDLLWLLGVFLDFKQTWWFFCLKNAIGILVMIALNLSIALGNKVILI